MIAYKNLSSITKTFYGVTFKPGETHQVPGYINSPQFIKVNSVPEEPPKAAGDKKTSKTEAKSDPKSPAPKTSNKEEKIDGTNSDQ